MKLNVLLVSDQVRGIDGAGGLGDVAAGLAKELNRRDDIDIRIVMPGYTTIRGNGGENPFSDVVMEDLPVQLGDRVVTVAICRYRLPKFTHAEPEVICYLIRESEGFQQRENSAFQAVLLARGTLAFLERFTEFRPDVIHCNDWHTALIPVCLNTVYKNDPYLAGIATLYTAHNNSREAYQGVKAFSEVEHLAGLPSEAYRPGVTRSLEHHGQFNFAKGGFGFADLITTVSATYARELRSRAFGGGLEMVLEDRARDLCGIVNGIDTLEWDPQQDAFLSEACRYSRNDSHQVIRQKKQTVRGHLREWVEGETGRPPFANVRDDSLLVGVITRVTDQKIPLMLPLREDTGYGAEMISPLERLCRENANLQIIVLGNAERHDERGQLYAQRLQALQGFLPDQFLFHNGFDVKLSHLIYAASEMFLVPSVFEPCGLTQLTSMLYGSVPIVRAVGGLDDTVIDESESFMANGFKFLESDAPIEQWRTMADVPRAAELLYQTVRRAISVKANQPRWSELVRNAMARDSSWVIPAAQYRKLYDAAVRQHLEQSFCVPRTLDATERRFHEIVTRLEHLFTMSAPVYFNLAKLASDRFGTYELNESFRTELHELRALGYIEFEAYERIPQRGDNLSEFVHATESGREFVRLRSALLRP